MKNRGSDIADSIIAEWNRTKKMKELAERKKEKEEKKKEIKNEQNA